MASGYNMPNMLPRENLKTVQFDAFWTFGVHFAAIVCENICKNVDFLYKNCRYCITVHYIYRGIRAYFPGCLYIVHFDAFWSTFSENFLLRK